MNISFITSEYPHKQNQQSVGGIGSFICNFSKSLIKNGHCVTIFLYSQDKEEIINNGDIEIHLIKKKKVKMPFTWWVNRKHIERYINKVIETKQIEIIEAPDWTGITAFMKFICPLVIRLHGSDTFFCYLEKRSQKRKNFFFEKKALFGADYVVGVSRFVAEQTQKLFRYQKEIPVIHNAIDVNDFKPDTAIKIRENTILYFGTLIRKKGVLELASIFNEVTKKKPTVKLLLLGKDTIDAKEKESTLAIFKNKLSKKSIENLEYIPHVNYEEIKKYIASYEVIVLPSFAEAFPMTWLEAMSMGKKLVTSNIGWSKELMIHNVTGLVENPKNHQGFASKILYLFDNKDKGEEYATNARDRIVKHFTMDRVVAINLEFYSKVLTNFTIKNA